MTRQSKMKTEREVTHKTRLAVGKKLRVAGVEVTGTWGDWVMAIKEGT